MRNVCSSLFCSFALFFFFLSIVALEANDGFKHSLTKYEEEVERIETNSASYNDPTIVGNLGFKSRNQSAVLKYPLTRNVGRDHLVFSECRVCAIGGLKKAECDSVGDFYQPCGIEGSYALKSSYRRDTECGKKATKAAIVATFVRDVRARETEYALVLDGTRRFMIEAFCLKGREKSDCARFPKHAECAKDVVMNGSGMCAYGKLFDESEGKFYNEDVDNMDGAKDAIVATFVWESPDFRRCYDLELNKRRDERANKIRKLYERPFEGRTIDVPIQLETTIGFKRKEQMFLRFLVAKENENGEYFPEDANISPSQVERILREKCAATLALIADAFHEIAPEFRRKDTFVRKRMDDSPEKISKETEKLWAKLGKKTREKGKAKGEKTGISKEVKDKLGHDWWKQIAKGAPSRKKVYMQDSHPVHEFGSHFDLEPPERHLMRLVIAGVPRRIRASGEQRTPYGTLFVATRDNHDSSLSKEYQAALLRSCSKCLRMTDIRIMEINPIHRKSAAGDEEVFPLEPLIDWIEKGSVYERTANGETLTEIDENKRNSYSGGENVELDWEGYSIESGSRIGWSTVSIMMTSDTGEKISNEQVREMYGGSNDIEYEAHEEFRNKKGKRTNRVVTKTCPPPQYHSIAPCLGYAEKPSKFRVMDIYKGRELILRQQRQKTKNLYAIGSIFVILTVMIAMASIFYNLVSQEQRFVVWAKAKSVNVSLRLQLMQLVAKVEKQENLEKKSATV